MAEFSVLSPFHPLPAQKQLLLQQYAPREKKRAQSRNTARNAKHDAYDDDGDY